MNAATLSDPISPSPRPAFSLCSHFLDLPSLPPHPADAPQLDSRLASRATALPTPTPPSPVVFLPALGAEADVEEANGFQTAHTEVAAGLRAVRAWRADAQ
jgi:hypothetical protein